MAVSVLSWLFSCAAQDIITSDLSREQAREPAISVSVLQFSPDGRYILASYRSTANRGFDSVAVLSVQPLAVLFHQAASPYAFTFSPDSKELRLLRTGSRPTNSGVEFFGVSQVQRFRLPDGHLIAIEPAHLQTKGCAHPEISPDLKTLACAVDKGILRVIDMATGHTLLRTEERAWACDNCSERAVGRSFTPDARYLVATSSSADVPIRIWDLRAMQELRVPAVWKQYYV